jgi:[ribosomal protein S18]-alanine N-acetyltransferase
MVTQLELSVREAGQGDQQKLANLIHFEVHVHRHLDWKTPLDWIGDQPYLVAEAGKKMIAALACPPAPDDVAWIRLFAVSSEINIAEAWDLLWPAALERMRASRQVQTAAVIPLQRWFQNLLSASAFEQTHRVVMLSRDLLRGSLPPVPDGAGMRPMSLDDLHAVEAVDAAAFPKVWQHSLDCLEAAFRQAALASVVELEGRVVGYQISTATPLGGHLARLAVLPDLQGRKIGSVLVADVLSQFARRGAHTLTVNTQQDNLASLALYEKHGFIRTGEEYPVYQYML